MSESNIDINFCDFGIKIHGFEQITKKKLGNTNYQLVNKFFPPFSLINISQCNQHLNKGPGHWFSNYEVLEILEELFAFIA